VSPEKSAILKNSTVAINPESLGIEESKLSKFNKNKNGSEEDASKSNKRGRKKGKGKELKDLLESFQSINGVQDGDVEKSNDKQAIQSIETKRRSKRILSPAKFHNYDNLMSTEEERMIKLAIKNSLVE
jgi:hypothetical protein